MIPYLIILVRAYTYWTIDIDYIVQNLDHLYGFDYMNLGGRFIENNYPSWHKRHNPNFGAHQPLANMNRGKLKEKILLIDSALLHYKLPIEDISTYYPFPYKVVDEDKIQEAIYSNDKRYAYIQHAPFIHIHNSSKYYSTYIVDTGNGNILATGGKSGISAYIGNKQADARFLIQKKQLIKFAQY